MKRGVGRFGPGFGKALSLTAGAATRKRAGSLLVSPVSCPSLSVQSVQENKRDEGRNTRQYEPLQMSSYSRQEFFKCWAINIQGTEEAAESLRSQDKKCTKSETNFPLRRMGTDRGPHCLIYFCIYIFCVSSLFCSWNSHRNPSSFFLFDSLESAWEDNENVRLMLLLLMKTCIIIIIIIIIITIIRY